MNNPSAIEQSELDDFANQVKIAGEQFLEMAFLLEEIDTQEARDEALKLRMAASRIALILDGNGHD